MPRRTISVIINNYNYGRFLGRAIDTALAQTGVAVEVVVVDDGSTDDSAEVIRSYGDRIRPVLQANGGQASAINAGVSASSGEILCFLDSDDWWRPGKLAAVERAFAAAPAAGLVYHRLQPVTSDGSPAFRAIPRTLCSGDLAPRMARAGGVWPFPMTSAIALRRRVWDEAGEIPIEFRISADAWLVGVAPLLANVVALPQVMGCYRIHQNNWYRETVDAAMLRKRMAHWALTVELTNARLATWGTSWRLRLQDHQPYRLAMAELHGAGPRERAELLLSGLMTAGEPNFARRARDALRGAIALSRDGLAAARLEPGQ